MLDDMKREKKYYIVTKIRFEVEAEGLFAVCIQHEIDHLKGKIFVDYLSPLKQKRLLKKIEKLAKQNASA